MCKNISLQLAELRVVGDYYEKFTPIEGQTVFSLTKTVLTAQEINRSRIFVNGVELVLTTDYTIASGNQLDISNYGVTFPDPDPDIDPYQDIVEAYY